MKIIQKCILLMGFLLALMPSDAFAQTSKVGDINGDGKLTVSDVLALVQIVLNEEDENQPTAEAGEAIDLGLPSGTKWANCNVGATKPEEYGGYYAWGEIEEKEVYNQSTYKYYQNGKYVNLGSDISGTEYDVAHVKWGGKWCMPTLDDIKELFDNCINEWTTLNGVNGRKFTSNINGKSIFFPAAGNRWDGDLYNVGSWGYYWSSTQYPDYSYGACYLYFGSGNAVWGYGSSRYGGQSVRPVTKSSNQSNIDKTICDINGDETITISDVLALVQIILNDEEDENEPTAEAGEAIDLGLPSGTKWANCNVGATKPEEYGGYYAWGEIEEKEVYNQSTYKYYQNGKYVNLGSDISGTEYDVAHVKWGGKWCMPTLDDIKELFDNCINEWTTLNGVNGRKFTSKINGKSIFFPAAGYRWNGDLYLAGEYGFYCSSSQDPDISNYACYLYFNSGNAYWHGINYRGYGQSVRPVVRN